MLLGFEHVGMSCRDLDASIAFYCDLLGLTLRLRKSQSNGGEVAFLDAGGGMLEISSSHQPVARARDVGPGESGMRHITLAFEDIDAEYQRLMAAGVEFIEKPRAAFNVEMLRKVCFCRDPDGIIVELVERNNQR